MKAVVINEFGGPDLLHVEERETPSPGPGEVLLRHTAIGVNFADVMMRRGQYLIVPDLPAIIGQEGAGIIEAVGSDVIEFSKGQIVAYVGAVGAYAEMRTVPTNKIYPVPDGVSVEVAGSSLLRGMTVQYLLNQTYPVSAGETILVHSAAGGIGSLMTQWGKHLGAKVIGTVSTAEKEEIAKSNGCDLVINYSENDFSDPVMEFTGGEGVRVVYDAVGKDTFEGNMNCLGIRGYFINFGAASGPVPMVDPVKINSKSLYFNKSSLIHYTADRTTAQNMAGEFFALIQSGAIKPVVGQSYPLSGASRAHQDLESRKTAGSVVLKV